jgi:alcohol dehydrogenase
VKAIVNNGPKNFSVDHVPDPRIEGPGDAVVRVEKTAICGSDLHMYHGPEMAISGFTMGHEFLGTVEDVGSEVHRFAPGQRVIVSCIDGCGHCASCNTGLYSGCEATTQLGPMTNVFGSPLLQGGQAEAARVPFADATLMAIPEDLSDDRVLFLTDILPTGYMGADLAAVGPGDVAVVFGCGPVGTFAQQAALLRGAACVVAVDLDDGRLVKAEARGCLPLNPSKQDLAETVKGLTQGRGADCVIEAVGVPELVQQAVELVRHGGRIAVIGVMPGGEVTLPFLMGMTGKNITLRYPAGAPNARGDHHASPVAG